MVSRYVLVRQPGGPLKRRVGLPRRAHSRRAAYAGGVVSRYAPLEQAAAQAAQLIDRMMGFRDESGANELARWQAQTTQAQLRVQRAERVRTRARVQVPVLLGAAGAVGLAQWWWLMALLALAAVLVGLRAASTPVPALPPAPPPPPVLPSATRSSSAYPRLQRAVAAREALAGLVPLVPPDVAELALETGAEVERVVAGLASALVPVEQAARTSGRSSAAADRLSHDLDEAVAAYDELVRTVDGAVAMRNDARLDEISARVGGIRAAVAALSPTTGH